VITEIDKAKVEAARIIEQGVSLVVYQEE